MADKQLRFVVSAEDRNASKVLGNTAKSAESMSHRIGGSISKLGSQIGGEFGDVLTRAGEGFETFGHKGLTATQKLTAAGTAVAGVGALLTTMGSGEKAAAQQLEVAITNSGHSIEDYGKQIEEAVKHNEHFGVSAVETKNALTILTNATHDPAKALQRMAVVADLAAVSHVSLDSAATQVAKALGGSARLFKAYGIQVGKNADGTKDYAGAVDQLGQNLHGQAAAAANTFTGKLKALRTEITDGAAAFGAKYGPAITSAGVILMATAPLFKLAASGARKIGSAFTASGVEATAASTEIAAADAVIVEGNLAAAGSAEKLAGSQGKFASLMKGPVGGTVALLAVPVAAGLAGKAISNYMEKGDSFAQVMFHMGSSVDKLNEAFLNNKGKTDEVGKAWLQAQLQSDGLAGKAAKAGISLDQMTTAIQGGGASTKEMIKQWEASGAPAGGTKIAVLELAGAYNQAADKAKQAGDSITNEGAATETAAAKTARLTTALQNLGQAQIGSLQSQDSFLSSLDSLTSSMDTNGHSLSANTAKGRANREAFLSAGSAAVAYANAQRKNGAPIATVTKNLEANVKQLIATAIHAGASKKQVDDLVKHMGLTPKQISTIFGVSTGAANAKLDALIRRFRSMDGKTVTTYTQVVDKGSGTVGATGGNHSGGGTYRLSSGGSDFFPGGDTMIAERETEMVSLPRGSKITPKSQLGHSVGGVTNHIKIDVHVPVGGNPAAVGKAIAGALGAYMNAGGSIQGRNGRRYN